MIQQLDRQLQDKQNTNKRYMGVLTMVDGVISQQLQATGREQMAKLLQPSGVTYAELQMERQRKLFYQRLRLPTL